MEILIIGGGGVMGRPLVRLLSQNKENKVYVVTRSGIKDGLNICNLQGNALDCVFMGKVLSRHYDAIIDFMVYKPGQLLSTIGLLLSNTEHYISLSSAAVYADSDNGLKETDLRFWNLNVSENEKEQYHIYKAIDEDIILDAGFNNYTIIRPHVTVNTNHLPFFIWTEQFWLYRALMGNTIIAPVDMMDKKTCITYGDDMAQAINLLINNAKAKGEIFNIASDNIITRQQLLNMYMDIFKKITGKELKVKFVSSKTIMKCFPHQKDRFEKDRRLNRTLDTSKFHSIIDDKFIFSNTYDILEKSMRETIYNLKNLKIDDAYYFAFCDRLTGEKTSLKYFGGRKKRIKYMLIRYFIGSQLYRKLEPLLKLLNGVARGKVHRIERR